MNFLKQPQGLFGPAQVEMVLHLDLSRVGKIAVEHWQMHLFASPGHGPVTMLESSRNQMLESSRNQTTSSC